MKKKNQELGNLIVSPIGAGLLVEDGSQLVIGMGCDGGLGRKVLNILGNCQTLAEGNRVSDRGNYAHVKKKFPNTISTTIDLKEIAELWRRVQCRFLSPGYDLAGPKRASETTRPCRDFFGYWSWTSGEGAWEPLALTNSCDAGRAPVPILLVAAFLFTVYSRGERRLRKECSRR